MGTDAFQTRLKLRRAIVATGPEAAEMRYRGRALTPRGATPGTTLKLLWD